MKRIIKYYSPYSSDGAKFSTCSTKYEIFPGLYPDDAGTEVLKQVARDSKIKFNGEVKFKNERYSSRDVEITHAIKLVGKIENKSWNRSEKYNQYLGFVKLVENDTLPALETIDNETPENALSDILNGSNSYELGIDDSGENVEGEYILVMSGWNFYHAIRLLGYSIDKFLKSEKIDDTYFNDSVSRCSQCSAYDSEDNGHTYNFRIIDGECLGINCGCFKEYALKNIESWVNKPDQAIESEVAEKLIESGRLKFIQRNVGGMTDSWRSHSYDGESVEIGNPESILESLLAKNPRGEYVFCHDESGQFQTYFSVYKVLPKRKSGKVVK